MTTQFSPAELQAAQSLLQDYAPAQNALVALREQELIVYVVNLVTLPINPAIATIVVLWVLKLGLRTFCEYTEPAPEA
ncbi:MAG: hypothetical protein WA949_22650 [Phormidesmis sp.]